MKVSLALVGVGSLFLDTAPIIYLVERNPAYFARVAAIFSRIDGGQIRAATSPVTLAECLVQPLKLGLSSLEQDFVDIITRGANTNFINLDGRIGREAARLRATYNLHLPDSLQIAACLTSGCDAFLTNDARLKKVVETRILIVDELDV